MSGVFDPARASVARTRAMRAHEAMMLLLELHDAFPRHWATTVATYPATTARLAAALSTPMRAVHTPVTGTIVLPGSLRSPLPAPPVDTNELDDPEMH